MHKFLIAGNNEGSLEPRQNVRALLTSNVIRAIYADYQIAESLKLELDYDDETSDFRKTNFPARYIYERLLPSVVEKFSNVYYHRASPYSGFGKPTTDKTYGDLHQCQPPLRLRLVIRVWLTGRAYVHQGTCGTGRKNPGTTGTSSQDALFLNSACTFHSMVSYSPHDAQAGSVLGRVTPTSALWTTGWVATKRNDTLNQGMPCPEITYKIIL
jgi:hypothetical protein